MKERTMNKRFGIALVVVLISLIFIGMLTTITNAKQEWVDPPSLISPGWDSKLGEMIDTLMPTLTWQEVPNADRYGLYISTYPYSSDHVFYQHEEIPGSETSFHLPDGWLEEGMMYRWNMASHSSAGWSYDRSDGGKKFSDCLYFTTGVNGIDVYSGKGDIDWSQVYNAGYRFAFIKATQGGHNIIAVLPMGSEGKIVTHKDNGVLANEHYWWYVEFEIAGINQRGWIVQDGLEKLNSDGDGLKPGDRVRTVGDYNLRNTPEITHSHDDGKFETNIDNAHKAGTKESPFWAGPYHYAEPNLRLEGEELEQDAKNEAKHFIRIAGDCIKSGYLRPALDVENALEYHPQWGVHYYKASGEIVWHIDEIAKELGNDQAKEKLSKWVFIWMETVKDETGVEPILYTNRHYAKNYYNDYLATYPLWITVPKEPIKTEQLGIWREKGWNFWQYSWDGSVPGIEGNVDLNLFNGDMSKLYTFVIPEKLSLDLIFAIDTTGSMWDDIDNVKADASTIVDDVLLNIPDARIAVVDYRDFPVYPYGGSIDYPFNDVLSFSTDKSAIVAAIQGLTLGWGYDWRESVYSALMHSIDSTSLGGWRGSDQAAKVIILMGDAPPHDPEPFTDYTLSSVSTAAELADPVIIYPIQIGGTVEKFEELADQTGGKAFTAENAGEVVDAILEALEEIKTKPVADANGPYTGFVGESITFDGTGSYDLDGSIINYEWDLDDDGEFDDATGATPTKIWDAPYSGSISLRVTDNDGATDIDSTTLTVKAIANQPPVADANGPYYGFIGEPITFYGSGSYDPDGTIVSYEWDLDDDGEFDDAIGETPTITFDEPYSGNIHLQVTDDIGATDTDPTTLTVKIPATIDFDPDTLNLKSKGRWVTIYIEFLEGYDVADIDASTILVNDQAHAEMKPIEVGDYDSDDIPDLMVKFDRADVQELLEAGNEVDITVTGELYDGSLFEGSDAIRVIDKGRGK